jgi:hypothetical protein
MRGRSTCGGVAFCVLGFAASVFAQADVNEEVRRAVERAVNSSIASSVSQSLSRSVASEGLPVMPTTTVFTSPFYNRTDGDFSFGSFEADTYGGVAGVLYKAHDRLLLHGAFAGSAVSVSASAGGRDVDVDARFVQVTLGADPIYLNTRPVKAWLTLEGSFANLDTDVTSDTWLWTAGPGTTVSVRCGDVLFEPNVGFLFGNTFEDDNADTTTVFTPGLSLKYRGERWRPQFNMVYQKTIDPSVSGDDGFISAGPEVLYAVRPSLLIGGAYTYGRPLVDDVDVNSHTVTLQFRWIF